MVHRVEDHKKVVVLALPEHQKELAQRQELQEHIEQSFRKQRFMPNSLHLTKLILYTR